MDAQAGGADAAVGGCYNEDAGDVFLWRAVLSLLQGGRAQVRMVVGDATDVWPCIE